VDNGTIDKANDLPRQIGNLKPGSQATIQVWRRGSARDIKVTIGEFALETTASAQRKTDDAKKGGALAQTWGLQVSEMTPEQLRELKIKGGVRIESATDVAARAGLREGDVITGVGNVEIRNLADFEAAMNRADKNRPLSLLFRRGEWAQYALIRPAK
jgi:serine protease Do